MGQVTGVGMGALLGVLALSLGAGTEAATYVMRSPLYFTGSDWLLESIFKDIESDAVDDVTNREQWLLSPSEHVIEVQIDTGEIDSVDIDLFDVLTPIGHEGASVFIDKITQFKFLTSTLVEYWKKSKADAELKPELGDANTVYCSTAKKMDCRNDSQRAAAAALLFSSRRIGEFS